MINRRNLAFIFLFLNFFSNAQPPQGSSADIKLALEKLSVIGSVLYIAAHPDDENTRLLAYLSKERKVRAGYLSLTRGDGGQNLIGNEQGELLGLIRTQELLAARGVDGAEQFFTRANDFGYSKTSEETLRIWDKEKVLSDMVWVIRNFKPDVIVTRFPEDARAGHGHHSSSAILAREAFFAAADAKRFPEQLKSVKPWQSKRLLWNTFNFNQATNTTSEDQLKINVGKYNALLGKSYGEIAAESRTKHKSQAFGTAAQRGDALEYFAFVAGEKPINDLLDGIDLSWNRFGNTENINKLIVEINRDYNISAPAQSIPKLLELKKLIDKTNQEHKVKELNELILSCLGIWCELNTPESQYASRDSVPVRLQVVIRNPVPATLKILLSENLTQVKNISLETNKVYSTTRKIQFQGGNLTQPYWLNVPHPQGYYVVNSQEKIGLPEDKSAFSSLFQFQIGDQTISVTREIVHKYTDQIRGEVYQPLVIAPPVTITPENSAYIFSGSETKRIRAELRSFKPGESVLKVSAPEGWTISPEQYTINAATKGEISFRDFNVTSKASSKSGALVFSIEHRGERFNHGYREIRYDHIPTQTYFSPSETLLQKIDLKSTSKKIAYLPGAGDLVAESLKQLGLEVITLLPDDVLKTDLTGFDAIVTGVRFFNVQRNLVPVQSKLFDYVKLGGILMVQYNRDDALQLNNIGPYPFSLSRSRVSEEEATVTILQPAHKVLNHPNKITNTDFENWIQERATYLATGVDDNYSTLLSMADKGEKANSGSLLVANYGNGRFVYSSLSFFRQLPAGVPGAYRLFMNLISK